VEYFLASIHPMFIVACHKSEATVQPKRGKKRKVALPDAAQAA
jgi:hypothetical protein